MIEGKITRISGPIVFAEGLDGCGLYDVVDVGEKRLIGEIIRQNKGNATIQVYEEDTGMHIGEKIVCHQRPLSLRLGPGLVGTIYDGIQRPLKAMSENSGAFLLPGERTEPLDVKKNWHFEAAPEVKEGSAVKPGISLGTVKETESITQKIMVPPAIRGKILKTFKGSGDYTIDDVIGTTEFDEEIKLSQYWPVRQPRPYADKLEVSEPLITGQRVIDTLFPIAKGGTAAIPGGFGTGKTMSQHQLAKWAEADIVVYIGCGERGNEMTDVLNEFPELKDPKTGKSLMQRTVLIANTSDMPVAAREASIYTGITIAEYFRDQGKDVLLMMDSLTRFSMAQREIGLASGEPPVTRGYPPSVYSEMPKLLERAGTSDKGSITGLYTVLVDGDDFNEPITDTARSILDGHIMLTRKLANKNHYPAIDVLQSISRCMSMIASKEHKAAAGKLKNIMATYNEAEDLINIGAYKKGSNPGIDNAINKIDSVNEFLLQSTEDKFDFDETINILQGLFS